MITNTHGMNCKKYRGQSTTKIELSALISAALVRKMAWTLRIFSNEKLNEVLNGKKHILQIKLNEVSNGKKHIQIKC